jgi:hypothetical protein
MVVDVVVEMDDIEAMRIAMARDNIPKKRIARHPKNQKRIFPDHGGQSAQSITFEGSKSG